MRTKKDLLISTIDDVEPGEKILATFLAKFPLLETQLVNGIIHTDLACVTHDWRAVVIIATPKNVFAATLFARRMIESGHQTAASVFIYCPSRASKDPNQNIVREYFAGQEDALCNAACVAAQSDPVCRWVTKAERDQAG